MHTSTDHAPAKSLGDRVRFKRTLLGITQVELARRIAKDQTAISKIENGVHVPSGETLLALSRALGESVDWLASGGDVANELETLISRLLDAFGEDGIRQLETATDEELEQLARLFAATRPAK